MNKEKLIKYGIVTFCLLVLVASLISLSITYNTFFPKDKFTFILDGKEMTEIMGCSEKWNYENISVVPCGINETIFVLQPEVLWWDVSPQENCARFNSTFVGFNINNDTRAKEIYDSTLPICWTLYANNLPEGWLDENCESVPVDGSGCEVEKSCVVETQLKCGENLYYAKVQ